MLKLHELLGEATNDFSRRRIIQQLEKVIEHFAVTGGRASFKSGRLQKIWTECHPKSWESKDGGGPVYGELAKMVAILMGSFPISKISEPEIFVRVLLDDLMELRPSFVEMESTSRQLRTKNKFMSNRMSCRLVSISYAKMLTPVVLPPGCASEATRRSVTRSPE